MMAIWTAATGAEVSLSVGDEATLQASWDTLKTGSMSAVTWLNLHEGIWPKLQFLFGWFGRGYRRSGCSSWASTWDGTAGTSRLTRAAQPSGV